jgi:hypothetical protein
MINKKSEYFRNNYVHKALTQVLLSDKKGSKSY